MNRAGDIARRAIADWYDPRARALRRRRRANRATVLRTAVAGVSGAVAFAIGESSDLELTEVAAGSVAVLAAVAAGSAGIRAVRLHRTPLPHPIPGHGSAAREPLHRLAMAETRLAELLTELGTAPFAPDAAPRPPAEMLADIRVAADRAAGSVRATADSLVAVERAAEAAPPVDQPGLRDAVEVMRRRLAAGVDEFGGLVAVAGQTLALGDPGAAGLGLGDVVEKLESFTAALGELPKH